MPRPRKQYLNNQQLMTETPSAEITPTPTVVLTEGFIKEKALAVVAALDNSLQIIPFRCINKISTLSRNNPNSMVNGILVKHPIEDILNVLEWDTKTIEPSNN